MLVFVFKSFLNLLANIMLAENQKKEKKTFKLMSRLVLLSIWKAWNIHVGYKHIPNI